MEAGREWRRTLRLSFTFAGGFLGAGFVSGRELWQFFGSYGWQGLLGVLLTGALFGAAGCLIMEIGLALYTVQAGEIAAGRCLFLRRGIEALQGVFLFAVATIMLAAGAALLRQLWGIPLWAGGLMLLLLVVGIGGSGLKGLISFFSGLVPLLLFFSGATALLAVAMSGFSGEFPVVSREHASPLLADWRLAALSYTSYNILGTMGLQASLIREGRNKRELLRAVFLGVLFLMLMAFCMLFALFAMPEAARQELPMLELACRIHPVFGNAFGIVLLGGMLGACLTGLVLLTDLLDGKRRPDRRGDKRKILAGLGLLCFAGSFLGFGSLVAVVYPLFGYAGFLVLGCLVVNGIRVRRRKGQQEEEREESEK